MLALGSGWLLAHRALIPIEAITKLANRIGKSDLSQRIDLQLPNDEVGRLAQTFNRMLDRIQSAFQRQKRFTTDAAHELRTRCRSSKSVSTSISVIRARRNSTGKP